MAARPLPLAVQEFLDKPHPAVVAVLRPDGSPASVATWYAWEYGRILLNMDEGRRRLRWIERDHRVALTVIDATDFYRHVSLYGEIQEIEEDIDLAAIDRLAQRYTGRPYRDRTRRRFNAWMLVHSWHAWNDAPWRPH